MASTAKPALKPLVAKWLDLLDAGFDRELEPPSETKREPEATINFALAKHIWQLRRLVQADFSPILSRSEAGRYWEGQTDRVVPLDRNNFPPGYCWEIIKKWDRWRKLSVIPRITHYVNLLSLLWENHCKRHGGPVSEFTKTWIQHRNLVNVHIFLEHRISPEQLAHIDKQFPTVAVINCIQDGNAERVPRVVDIGKLEPFASQWCTLHVITAYKSLKAQLRTLEKRADYKKLGVDAMRHDADVLYVSILARDIQLQHQRSMIAVDAWDRNYDVIVSGFLRTLGNDEFIQRMIKVIPMSRIGDHALEQKARTKDIKKASKLRHCPGDPSQTGFHDENDPLTLLHEKIRRQSVCARCGKKSKTSEGQPVSYPGDPGHISWTCGQCCLELFAGLNARV